MSMAQTASNVGTAAVRVLRLTKKVKKLKSTQVRGRDHSVKFIVSLVLSDVKPGDKFALIGFEASSLAVAKNHFL
jgi:hypothetical protein